MQAVCKLVRLGSYEGRRGLVYHAVEFPGGDIVQQRAEFLLYKGENQAAELPAPADYVFIEPGPSQMTWTPWERFCFGMLDLAKRRGW